MELQHYLKCQGLGFNLHVSRGGIFSFSTWPLYVAKLTERFSVNIQKINQRKECLHIFFSKEEGFQTMVSSH
jgi:hypothetical protein